MAKLGRFQMQSFSHWKGLTSDNHLGSVFQSQPQKATNLMVQLLAFYRGKNLETYLSQFPVKEFETEDDYTWDVIGSTRRNIPLVEVRDESNTTINTSTNGLVGVGFTPFYVVFAEDWFAKGNVIVGEKNEAYPLQIVDDPILEGSHTRYKVVLMGNVSQGMPYSELTFGKRFSHEYSPVEREMSREVGDIRFTAPISMRNEFSHLRIQHKVAGNKLDRKLAFGIPFVDNHGKAQNHNMWMHHIDFKLEEEFRDEKARLIMYGRSNRNSNGEYNNFGQSGNVIKMGAGLREQMEISNTTYYNRFSLKLIEDALYYLSASKLDMSDRTFILRTGEMGAKQFHKAVLDVVSGWTMFVLDNNSTGVVSKTSSPLHQNSLKAGFQFTEFLAPNGVKVKVEVDPFYDDPVRNKILHPDGGVAESYRYDIMYIGTMDQPNIQLARVKGVSEMRMYRWGFRNPFTGQVNNNNASWGEDSAQIDKMWIGGVFILDPTRTMSIIPAILR